MKGLPAALMAVVLTAATVTGAQAEPGRGFGPMPGGFPGPGFAHPERMLEHMADYLDLDDAQRASVQNILEAAKPELEALREKTRANHEALRTLDAKDPGYSTRLNNIALSNGQLATEGTLLSARIRNDIDAVLTDAQREKLALSQERMRERFEDRKHRH